SIPPRRWLDTREGSRPVTGSSRCFQVAGKNGIPKSASAVAVNLTVVSPTGDGFLLARPAGRTAVTTSTINFAAGDVRANNAVVRPGAFGRVCVYARTTSHFVFDVVGYWPGNEDPAPILHPHTFTPANTTQFLDALEKAASGDVVKLA